MNISAINDQAFQGKYGVTIIGELGDTASSLYKNSAEEIGTLTKNFKRNIRLLERNNVLYANSGSITSTSNITDLAQSTSKFFNFISGNVKANTIAQEKGLTKGLNYLA